MKRGGFSTTNSQVNDMKHSLKALKLTGRIKNQVVETLSRISHVTENDIKYPYFSLASTHQLINTTCHTKYWSISMTSVVCRNLRGLCYGCLLYFVYNANYTSLFPMKLSKLPVNDKNTASCQTNTSPRYQWGIIQNGSQSKNELWNAVSITSYQNHSCNPFQTSSSL